MCTTIVLPDGKWVGSPRDLADLGWEVTEADADPEWASYPDWRDFCFCGVDVLAVLDRHGVEYVDDGTGYIEVKVAS